MPRAKSAKVTARVAPTSRALDALPTWRSPAQSKTRAIWLTFAPSALSQRREVGLVYLPVRGRRPRVVADERHTRAVPAPGRPRPREVPLLARIEPAHDRVEIRLVAVVGSDLGREDRHLRGGGADVGVVTRDVAAGVEVVDVPRGDEVVQRVRWLVGDPLRQRVAPGETAEADDVRSTGGADRVHERLHTGDLE